MQHDGTPKPVSYTHLSAKACNGVILLPGEVFSYNNTTGSRSASKGYQAAPVYVGGASTDEVGGGICQTSSTIYYAVLHTTLEVVERRSHMYNTGYVPVSYTHLLVDGIKVGLLGGHLGDRQVHVHGDVLLPLAELLGKALVQGLVQQLRCV